MTAGCTNIMMGKKCRRIKRGITYEKLYNKLRFLVELSMGITLLNCRKSIVRD
jgi:hypothetical protein